MPKYTSSSSRYPSSQSQSLSALDIALCFLAFFLPPAAVFIKRGCGSDVVINCGLWLLFWIPGVLHAIWVITKNEGHHGTRY